MATYFDLVEAAKSIGLESSAIAEFISTQLDKQRAAETEKLQAIAQAAKATADAAKDEMEQTFGHKRGRGHGDGKTSRCERSHGHRRKEIKDSERSDRGQKRKSVGYHCETG